MTDAAVQKLKARCRAYLRRPDDDALLHVDERLSLLRALRGRIDARHSTSRAGMLLNALLQEDDRTLDLLRAIDKAAANVAAGKDDAVAQAIRDFVDVHRKQLSKDFFEGERANHFSDLGWAFLPEAWKEAHARLAEVVSYRKRALRQAAAPFLRT